MFSGTDPTTGLFMEDLIHPDIVMVEDNLLDAELMLRALKKQKEDLRLLWLRDGAEALDFVFSRGKFANCHTSPRLIILDLKLPRVGGVEVLREIKQYEKTRRIPVVVFSSSCEWQDLSDCYDIGVNSYVVKSADYHSFMKSVTEMEHYWSKQNQIAG